MTSLQDATTALRDLDGVIAQLTTACDSIAFVFDSGPCFNVRDSVRNFALVDGPALLARFANGDAAAGEQLAQNLVKIRRVAESEAVEVGLTLTWSAAFDRFAQEVVVPTVDTGFSLFKVGAFVAAGVVLARTFGGKQR